MDCTTLSKDLTTASCEQVMEGIEILEIASSRKMRKRKQRGRRGLLVESAGI